MKTMNPANENESVLKFCTALCNTSKEMAGEFSLGLDPLRLQSVQYIVQNSMTKMSHELSGPGFFTWFCVCLFYYYKTVCFKNFRIKVFETQRWLVFSRRTSNPFSVSLIRRRNISYFSTRSIRFFKLYTFLSQKIPRKPVRFLRDRCLKNIVWTPSVQVFNDKIIPFTSNYLKISLYTSVRVDGGGLRRSYTRFDFRFLQTKSKARFVRLKNFQINLYKKNCTWITVSICFAELPSYKWFRYTRFGRVRFKIIEYKTYIRLTGGR